MRALFVSPPSFSPSRVMPGADNVYMAKLAEQAERYEEMVRAHRCRRIAPSPHLPTDCTHPPPTDPARACVCVRRLST